MKSYIRLLLAAALLLMVGIAYLFLRRPGLAARHTQVVQWINDPQAHLDWSVQAGQHCHGAPFALPTDGYIGYLWDDLFRIGHRHQGIDIFGAGPAGETPIYAAFGGYLTRLPDWKSSLIVRVPEDPLQPDRQIWTYYTHMADSAGNSFISADFPPSTSERFIKAGTLLGYMGNFSGTPGNPVGVHLHFSIVQDDGQGKFRNELKISNTLNPSPYFNLPLNGRKGGGIPVCFPEGSGGNG